MLCMILARAPIDERCCWNAVELCKAYNARLKACCASTTSSAGLSIHPADAEIEVPIDVSLTAKIKIYDNKARRLQLLRENWNGGDLHEDVALLFADVTPLPDSDRLDEIVCSDALFTENFNNNCNEMPSDCVYEQLQDLVLRNDVWLEFEATGGDIDLKKSEITKFLPTLIFYIKSNPVFNANLEFLTENSRQDKIVVCCQNFDPSLDENMDEDEKYDDTFMLEVGFKPYKYSYHETTSPDLDQDDTYAKITLDDNGRNILKVDPPSISGPNEEPPIRIYYYYLQTKKKDELIDGPEWFNIWLAGHATSHQSACISPLVIDALMQILYEASHPNLTAGLQLRSFLRFSKLSPREAIEQLHNIMSVREFALGDIEKWNQSAPRHLAHWKSNKVQILPLTEDGMKTANNSVSEHLGGSFDNFLKYSPDQHTVLAATLKVKIMWQIKFYPARMEDFTDISNSKVQVPMMRSTAPIPKCWQEAETYDMAVIPIQGDNNTEMRVFMPKKRVSIQQLLSQIRKHHLFEDKESRERKNCYVKIPKFKMTCEDADMASFLSKNTQLTNVFQNSKDFAIFEKESSGFDRVCTMVEFEIHEDGAEVKAAAKAEAIRGGLKKEIVLDLNFDRPFIAYIVHKGQQRISVASIYTGHLGIKPNHYPSNDAGMSQRGLRDNSPLKGVKNRSAPVERQIFPDYQPRENLQSNNYVESYNYLDKKNWLEIKIAECDKGESFEEGKIVNFFPISARKNGVRADVQPNKIIRIQITPIISGIKKLLQKFDDLNGETEEQTLEQLPAKQNRELMFPLQMDPQEINHFHLKFWLDDASKPQSDAFVNLVIHGV